MRIDRMDTAGELAGGGPLLRGARFAFVVADGPVAAREERRLIEGAKSGSEESVETLFRLHWPRALRASYLVVGDAAAAEDIAQEAFLSAIRNLDRFDRRRPFGPWLHRIVVNRAIDWTRLRRYRREVRVDFATDEPAGLDAKAGAADPPAPGVSDELMAALAALSAEHRAVVVLRYLLEYTPGEIAAALDLPRGTVNSRLRRALDRLGEAYGGEEQR